MRSATWQEFRDAVSADEGALPDGVVEGLTLADWQVVLDAVTDAGWRIEYIDGDGVPGKLPRAAEALPVPQGQGYRLLRVWPLPDVQVNIWFRVAESLEFDLDPRELRGEIETEALMGFIQLVGIIVQREVRIMSDGFEAAMMARYDPEADAFEIIV